MKMLETINKDTDSEFKDIEMITVAIRNPKNSVDRSWLYNIFLGGLLMKNKRDKQKTNWIVDIQKNDIKKLEERGCEVIKLGNSIEKIITKDSFKEGYKVMLELFNKLMKSENTKNEIRKVLSTKDGRPSEDYKTIMKTNKMLEEK